MERPEGLINDTIILTVEGEIFNEGIQSNNDSIGFFYDGWYNKISVQWNLANQNRCLETNTFLDIYTLTSEMRMPHLSDFCFLGDITTTYSLNIKRSAC